ncbi:MULTISPECIES: hypothetical protein [Prevotella]|uniref:DUF5056 domain-containing protein n=1 Tax=Prevotella herbatica TaxID=2801997 RepID=A0ABM7NXU6_9BACT|nr:MULTISPECIES: hypothetical protein [Prevotella]MDN5553133.1 hypothetical protein [Prevotella sp.]BCS85334.1 hypothetical protein prwr041_12270 [Prevotella herbatica]
MTKDRALEDLFLAAKPSFDNTDQFMPSLIKRLDAVEYLKQHEEACIRRYRYGMIAAFVLGIVCGGIILAIILSMPANRPLIKFDVESGFLFTIFQQSRIIATVFLSGLICFFIISVINALNEIISMKEMLPFYK